MIFNHLDFISNSTMGSLGTASILETVKYRLQNSERNIGLDSLITKYKKHTMMIYNSGTVNL